jgi:GT2 family glycosyltransferase
VALAGGEFVLLLNNDVEIMDRGWLKEMVSCFDYENVGIVGAKLLYPNLTLQHAGVIAGLGGYAGHWFIGQGDGFPGPMGRLWVRQSLSVVTGACMLVSKTCLAAVGTFDETTFPVAYNDVDFCLRAVNAGFRVVWTPFACLIHHESASRGSDETKENIDRFNRDKANLRKRHRTDVLEDRAFNPWYSKHESYPYPVALGSLPRAR